DDLCDRMRLLDRAASRTIRDIRSGQLERPPEVVAAAGVEFRGVVREGEQVSPKKLLEAEPCGGELPLALVELSLRDEHISKAPPDLWIAARKCWHEERFRAAGLVLARVDLSQVHTHLHITRQVSKCASIPERGEIGVRHG